MLSLDSPDTRLPSTATDSFARAHSDDDRRWLYGDVSRFPENTRLPISSCVFVYLFRSRICGQNFAAKFIFAARIAVTS